MKPEQPLPEILPVAIRYLARREYAQAELKQRLGQKGYQAQAIENVIEHLIELGYQSDERFAESLMRRRVEKGYGWLYIKQELRHFDISDTIITKLHENQQIDWYLQAELAYNRRFGDTEVADLKDKAKRVRFLQQRGFVSEQIFHVAALQQSRLNNRFE